MSTPKTQHSFITLFIFTVSSLRSNFDILHPFLYNRYERVPENTTFPEKPTTVLVLVAARNDLDRFVRYNLSQLESIGTNHNITFLVDLHTIQKGKAVSQRFIIYKNKLVQVGEEKEFDSGSPETLISACTWAFTNFPAEVKVLVLWNHGTGAIEPNYRVAVNPSNLYTFNPATNLIELDRTIGFLNYLQLCNTTESRGICFDNVTKNYLTNHNIGEALKIVHQSLKSQLSIVSCDACLMACIETMCGIILDPQNPVAKYFVGSQEVVLATGYPYSLVFGETARNPQTAEQLARHFVTKFAQSYHKITQDYTQSAVALDKLSPLYAAIDNVANLLIVGMKQEVNKSVRSLISISSDKGRCTCFEEPSYKDMSHLFKNMRDLVPTVMLINGNETRTYREQLTAALTEALMLIKSAVIANASGKNLAQASGLSIYVPTQQIHSSYPHTDFGSTSVWTPMLELYLSK
jgi:hypothetical protein